MKLVKCTQCKGQGYYEISNVDPWSECESCFGLAYVIKQLTPQEVREQFEKTVKGIHLLDRDEWGTYESPTIQQRWNSYQDCVRVNDLVIKENK